MSNPTASPTIAELNRDEFKRTMCLTALRVPTTSCQPLMRRFRGFTLDKPRLRCVVLDGDRKDSRLLLLDENMTVAGLSEELRSYVEAEGLETVPHEVTLDYSYFSHDQVLKRLLPASVEAPSSFECVGHIAHLNLRDECLPYKYLIGQVILDKHQHIKTVVNKVGSIENEYRVFEMEILAGEKRLETEVKQHNARFKLDFSQVYWNSRLETEHHRLVGRFKEGELIADIMAGIGPFAIPAGQKGCQVHANDLNPSSVHWLHQNIKINRMQQQVLPFNMDGRQFVRMLLGSQPVPVPAAAECTAAAAAATGPAPEDTTSTRPTTANLDTPQTATSTSTSGAVASASIPAIPEGFTVPKGGLIFQHAVMNLPASAVEFLDAFHSAFDPGAWEGRPLPLVHCYTFRKAAETEADIIRKVEHYLGGPLEEDPEIHVVRDVAPNKIMLCVSFRVPCAVAFAGRMATTDQSETAGKVAKTASAGKPTNAAAADDMQEVEGVHAEGGLPNKKRKESA